jgi:hypothetical protein
MKKLIGYMMSICWITAHWVKGPAIETKHIHTKHNDLVVVILPVSIGNESQGNTQHPDSSIKGIDQTAGERSR